MTGLIACFEKGPIRAAGSPHLAAVVAEMPAGAKTDRRFGDVGRERDAVAPVPHAQSGIRRNAGDVQAVARRSFGGRVETFLATVEFIVVAA